MMASSSPSINVSIGFVVCALLVFFPLFLSSLNLVFAVGVGVGVGVGQTFHTIQVSALLPSSVCRSSTKGHSKTGSLKVVHRRGPCAQWNQDQASALSLTEILSHDQSRVESIQRRFGFSKAQNCFPFPGSRVTLPDKSGDSIGAGSYIVTVGLGTPKRDLSLIFDTGSGITWIQCEPCVKCYQQNEPIYNPSSSKSYKNITCNSPYCSQLTYATGLKPNCASTTCVYGSAYADGSTSFGFLAYEKLRLTRSPYSVFPYYIFGCGLQNQGILNGSAGLLGLDRGPFSPVSQLAFKYGKYFSYCLPTSTSSTGTLTFGKGGTKSTSIKFTPLLVNPQQPTLYFVDIIGIKVGGHKLPIPKSVFKTPAGTIVDSGTDITRLQPAAYAALRESFRAGTKAYKLIKVESIFDTCYDFTGVDKIHVPTISFLFAGNIEVPISFSGTIVSEGSQGCLAFAGNSNASDVGIIGNVQQQTLDVVYDIEGGKIGFGTGGCS